MQKYIRYISALLLAVFALLTLYLSSSIIFDLFGMRAKQGNYVSFVIWANFISGFLYLGAVYGFIKQKKWTFRVLMSVVFLLLITGIGLYFHIKSGGLYKTVTPKALLFRTGVSLFFSIIAIYTINKVKNIKSN